MRTSAMRWAMSSAGILLVSSALALPVASAASATKAQSAPVFSSKATAKAKQGKAFTFTVKTKANPTADVSLTGALPPGVTFTDNHDGTATLSDPTPLAGTYSIGLAATNTTTQLNTTTQTLALTVTSKLPLVRHVFVIMFENNDYSATFGNPSADPYLAETLPSQGLLLKDYYGIGHFSNDNYAGDPLRPAAQQRQPAGLPRVGILELRRWARRARRDPAGRRLRVPERGDHPGQPARQRRAHLEGLPGGHGERSGP